MKKKYRLLEDIIIHWIWKQENTFTKNNQMLIHVHNDISQKLTLTQLVGNWLKWILSNTIISNLLNNDSSARTSMNICIVFITVNNNTFIYLTWLTRQWHKVCKKQVDYFCQSLIRFFLVHNKVLKTKTFLLFFRTAGQYYFSITGWLCRQCTSGNRAFIYSDSALYIAYRHVIVKNGFPPMLISS